MGDSKLTGRLAGRYKMVFLDYLQKAEDLCECEELLTRCEHLCDMRKAYGMNLATVTEYREEFLSLCGTLCEKYGLNGNFDETFGRVEMNYKIRREEEEAAYGRLKRIVSEVFGTTGKVVQMRGNHLGLGGIRTLLTEDEDAAMRRRHFRRLLMREGDPISPVMMATYFTDKIYSLYSNVSKIN